jgi:hypothetical protein
MEFIGQLWLPIVVSAALVFAASVATHMLVPYRRTEWRHAPGEGAIQQALKGAAPGLYAFPMPTDPRERGQPEAMRRWAEGPSGFLALVPPGPIDMGRNLALSLGVNLLVSFLAAYAAFLALGAAAPYLPVMRVVSVIGFLAYAVGPVYEAIWYWRPWRSLAIIAAESLLFGLLMGGIFGWLWPR